MIRLRGVSLSRGGRTLIADATRFILRGYGLSDALIDRYWPVLPADRAAAA